MTKAYVPECLDLAEMLVRDIFVGLPPSEFDRRAEDLAKTIQGAIEDWMRSPQLPPSNAAMASGKARQSGTK